MSQQHTIHSYFDFALVCSLYLHKLGKAPLIEDLLGTATFTGNDFSFNLPPLSFLVFYISTYPPSFSLFSPSLLPSLPLSLPPSLPPSFPSLYRPTEEEISAMRKELDKYGIQMPHFGKIGGILANEVPKI